jgi:nucleoside 2-deoxyribosyltransferase
MMMMDPDHPELEDVKTTIREEFARVNIRPVRADEIEHSGEITHRILEEIKNAEFLLADFTGGRPSVYYEIGYAHAIGKRVIM